MVASSTTNTRSAVAVLLSGGLDSLACAHMLIDQGHKARAMFIDYGQASLNREHEATHKLAEYLDIPLTFVTARGDHPFATGELIGRNAFFITAAMFLGRVNEGIIALGIHSGTSYYDCTPSFLTLMKNITEEQTEGRVSVAAPFVDWNKKQIYQYLSSANLPLEDTYSCEAGTLPTCRTCASCLDREELGC